MENGRSFQCSGCPDRIKALRRCREDLEFTKADNPSLWPMHIRPGGLSYGFCPGKATWEREVSELYKSLVVATETGVMLEAGGLNDQPSWWMEQMSWFVTAYKSAKLGSIVDGFTKSMPGLAKLARGSARSGHNPRVAPG